MQNCQKIVGGGVFPERIKMVYNDIVNEELRIAAIHISELNIAYATSFLNQWEEEAKLSQLTLYYDIAEDYLVINRDNKHFQEYLEIAEVMLSQDLDDELRMEFVENVPDSVKETVNVLENCRNRREAAKELEILNHQSYVGLENTYVRKVLEEISQKNQTPLILMCEAYNYGIMQGKRAERARRKGGVVA